MINAVLLFLNIGTPELILIMFVALMLFGGDKLPGLARGLGRGIRDFKDASEGVKRELNNQIYNYEDKKPAALLTDDEPEAAEPEKLEERNEDKPLLDYTPIEGTVPVGGSSINLEKQEDNNAVPVEHTETHSTAGTDKPAN